MIRECPSCGTQNRVPSSQAHRAMKCGACKEMLPPVDSPSTAAAADAPRRDVDARAHSGIEGEAMPDWESKKARRGPGYGAVIAVSLITSALASVLTVYALDRMQPPWRTEEPAGPDTVEVPSVLNMPSATAGELLEARQLRLVVQGERHDPSEAPGSVVDQSPLPDSRVAPNSEVRVTLSIGPEQLVVPEILGRPLEEARSMISETGLAVGTVTEGGEGSAGSVTGATPAPGAEAARGDRVDLTVAPSGIVVPDLVGKRSREARATITAARLTVGRIRVRYDEDRGPYVVLSQEPAAGAQVPEGQAVDLVINEGD